MNIKFLCRKKMKMFKEILLYIIDSENILLLIRINIF